MKVVILSHAHSKSFNKKTSHMVYTKTHLGLYHHVKYCTKAVHTHLSILLERNKLCVVQFDNVSTYQKEAGESR